MLTIIDEYTTLDWCQLSSQSVGTANTVRVDPPMVNHPLLEACFWLSARALEYTASAVENPPSMKQVFRSDDQGRA